MLQVNKLNLICKCQAKWYNVSCILAGDITLSCASFLPNLIKAVIVINCCLSSVGFPTLYKDQRVEGLDFDKNLQKLKITDDGMIDMLGVMHDVEDNPDSVNVVFMFCIPFYVQVIDLFTGLIAA